jgi:hypothetical protein
VIAGLSAQKNQGITLNSMTEISPMPVPAAKVLPAGSQNGKLVFTIELDHASALLPLTLPKAECPTG